MVKHYFVVAQGGGLQFLSDAFGYLLELFRRELQVWCIEAHVGLALHGDEVDVGMGNFEPQHALSYFDAGDGTLDGVGYLLGEHLKTGEFVVFEVEDVVHLTFGNHECVPFLQGADVEEGVVAVVLGYLVARYFAGYDAGKDACHVCLRYDGLLFTVWRGESSLSRKRCSSPRVERCLEVL